VKIGFQGFDERKQEKVRRENSIVVVVVVARCNGVRGRWKWCRDRILRF